MMPGHVLLYKRLKNVRVEAMLYIYPKVAVVYVKVLFIKQESVST